MLKHALDIDEKALGTEHRLLSANSSCFEILLPMKNQILQHLQIPREQLVLTNILLRDPFEVFAIDRLRFPAHPPAKKEEK